MHDPAPHVMVFTPQTRVFTIPRQSPTDKVEPHNELLAPPQVASVDEEDAGVCAGRTAPLGVTESVELVATGVSSPAAATVCQEIHKATTNNYKDKVITGFSVSGNEPSAFCRTLQYQ